MILVPGINTVVGIGDRTRTCLFLYEPIVDDGL